MDILISPPKTILYITVAALALVIIAMLLKSGSWNQKIVALVITFAVIGGVIFLLYRPSYIRINAEGIRYDALVQDFGLAWSEVKRGEVIEDLQSSKYRPTVRHVGISAGAFKTGRFKLKNGSTARVVLQNRKSAVLLDSGEKLFLFGPDEFTAFIPAIEKYIDLQRP